MRANTASGSRGTAPPAVSDFDAQAVLLSPKFGCTEEVLTVVSLLSVDSVLHDPPSRRDEVQAVRRKFVSSEGDHVTLLNVYRAFRNAGGSKVRLRSRLPPSASSPPSPAAESSTEPRTAPGGGAPALGGHQGRPAAAADALPVSSARSEGASSPECVATPPPSRCQRVFRTCPWLSPW